MSAACPRTTPARRRAGGCSRGGSSSPARRCCPRTSVDSGAATAVQPQPRKGFPPLALSLGRSRRRRGARAPARPSSSTRPAAGKEAARIFGRFDSLEAKLGAAFAAWPASQDRIEQLGALFPRSALVQLHVGLARFWAGTGGALSRLARGPRRRAGHPVRRARRRPDPSRRLRARPARLRAELPLPRSRARRRPSSSSRSARRPDRTRPAPLRRGAAAARPPAVGAPRVRRGASARAERRRRARRRRRRPVRQEQPVCGVLAARAADAPLPAGGDGALPPRRAAALAEATCKEAKRQLRLARASEPGSPIAREAGRYLAELAKVGTG